MKVVPKIKPFDAGLKSSRGQTDFKQFARSVAGHRKARTLPLRISQLSGYSFALSLPRINLMLDLLSKRGQWNGDVSHVQKTRLEIGKEARSNFRLVRAKSDCEVK